MQNLLRLWFTIMLSTGTAWLEGEDTRDLRPVDDASYPLVPGRILMSPLSIEQFDVLTRVRIMIPLRKKVLDELQRLVLSNRPQSFVTIYLCTFILLHTSSVISADRRRHAGKHGSPVGSLSYNSLSNIVKS
jgi:hypothetical protein